MWRYDGSSYAWLRVVLEVIMCVTVFVAGVVVGFVSF